MVPLRQARLASPRPDGQVAWGCGGFVMNRHESCGLDVGAMYGFGSHQEFVDSSDMSWLEYARLCIVRAYLSDVRIFRPSSLRGEVVGVSLFHVFGQDTRGLRLGGVYGFR